MNKLKESLKKGRVSLGAWIQIPNDSIVEIIAKNSYGLLDWICIDMEHGSIGLESMTSLIRTIEGCGLTPFVRIPQNDSVWIHRALDAGAKGLIVPMIKSDTEACEAVSEALYPPLGKRSFGYCRANLFGADFEDYIKNANKEISIIIQIEHMSAIGSLDFILETPGVDGTFIGPYDLSGSMGMPGNFMDDEYQRILQVYSHKSKQHMMPSGIHVVRPTKENIQKAISEGYGIIAIGTDAVFIEERCNEIFEDIM